MAIARTNMRTQLTGDRMPAKSEKQRRYMAMAYNDPDMGVPKEVAKKFMKKPAQGYKAGGKVRGAGIAQKGVRACKMR